MVPIPTSSAAPITNPTTVPASPRHAVDPVAEALVRSTDRVPRTTQNACWTPVASATATAAASAIAARSELRNQTERTDACRRTSVAAAVAEATPGARASAAAALAGTVPGSAPGDSYQCRRAASIVFSDALMADDQRVGRDRPGHHRERLRVHRLRGRDPRVRLARPAGQLAEVLGRRRPGALDRVEVRLRVPAGEQRLGVAEEVGRAQQQRPVLRAALGQVDVPVERLRDLGRAPLQELHHAAEGLVGGGEPGRPVRRRRERRPQPVLGRHHRVVAGHLARRGRPDPAREFARQIGDGGPQPVGRAGGDSSSTAMVPAADASHQPSSRLGRSAAPPTETTGST